MTIYLLFIFYVSHPFYNYPKGPPPYNHVHIVDSPERAAIQLLAYTDRDNEPFAGTYSGKLYLIDIDKGIILPVDIPQLTFRSKEPIP